MDHEDHVALIRSAVEAAGSGGEWADLGSGWGAFTLALADLLGPGSTVYSVDRDRGSLREQERNMHSRFPSVHVEYVPTDFTRPLDLPPLDGIVMANSLHFVKDKLPLVERLRGYLKPEGRFVLVEYNADRGNMWVPHPLSYPTWESLARGAGFASTRLIARHPSRFLGEIYAAESVG
jgi:ubiquinone/menaquinone biosynthesis C-methylase UbiE